jgi:nucleoside-diphosphate-sugar epimerase
VPLDLAWATERFALPADLDAVINLAAHFGGPDFDAMLTAEEVNVLGSLKLAHACKRAGVGQLVQVSSIFAGIGEESPFYTSYGLSKRHAEELTQLYCRSVGLPLAILRPAQLYGEGDGFRRHQPFLYTLMDRAQRGEDIVLYGSHDALRNFIHVDDVAKVIALVVRLRIEGRYDCASLSNVRFSEIAAAAVAAFGSASAIRFDPTQPDIPDNAFAADGSLYRRIDYFPSVSLAQGMAREAARRRALP